MGLFEWLTTFEGNSGLTFIFKVIVWLFLIFICIKITLILINGHSIISYVKEHLYIVADIGAIVARLKEQMELNALDMD